MSNFLAMLGGAVLLWWIAGVILLCCTKVYVAPGTPWYVKVLTVFVSGWVLPWIFLQAGRLPRSAIIGSREPDEKEEADIKEWLVRNRCDCARCRERRGE